MLGAISQQHLIAEITIHPTEEVGAANEEFQDRKNKREKKDCEREVMSQCPSVASVAMKRSTFEDGRSRLWPYLVSLCGLSPSVENKGIASLLL